MTAALAEQTAQSTSPSLENFLVRLATPIFEAVLQLRTGALLPTNDVRQRLEAYLRQFEDEAAKREFRDRQVKAAKYALVAFIDETVLAGPAAPHDVERLRLKDDWRGAQLLIEHFGDTKAGDVFFDKLQELIKAGPGEAEVVEVYYLCLLLGYRGRYLIHREQEFQSLVAEVANHLASPAVRRLHRWPLAPRAKAPDQPGPLLDPGLPAWAKWAGGAWLWSLVLLGLIMNYLLNNRINKTIKELLR